MYRYAQIDVDTGICVSVSNLSGEVIADHLLPLTEEDVQPGDVWDGESWSRPDPPELEPQPDRVTQLESELLQTQLALAELAEANEQDKTESQLALAELAELITGGAE